MEAATVEAFVAFLSARDRLLRHIRARIGDNTFGKSYEGLLSLTFPSCLEEEYRSGEYTVVLEAAIMFSRTNAWSGSTLSALTDAMNKDIDLYEANLTKQPNHSPRPGA